MEDDRQFYTTTTLRRFLYLTLCLPFIRLPCFFSSLNLARKCEGTFTASSLLRLVSFIILIVPFLYDFPFQVLKKCLRALLFTSCYPFSTSPYFSSFPYSFSSFHFRFHFLISHYPIVPYLSLIFLRSASLPTTHIRSLRFRSSLVISYASLGCATGIVSLQDVNTSALTGGSPVLCHCAEGLQDLNYVAGLLVSGSQATSSLSFRNIGKYNFNSMV